MRHISTKTLTVAVGMFSLLTCASWIMALSEINNVPAVNIGPLELFEDETCSAGCWQSLRPGITSEDELIAFLD